MNGNGAYPEEMDFSHPEIATFARSLQATLVREPDPVASEDMVRRLARGSARLGRDRVGARSARPAPSGRAGRGWSRRRLAAVALAVAVLPLLTAGLAVAGVRLPAVAENAFEAVGVDLPNQGRSGSSDDPADADQGSGNDGEPARLPGGRARLREGSQGRPQAGQRPAEPQQRRRPGTGPESSRATRVPAARRRASRRRPLARPSRSRITEVATRAAMGKAIGKTDSTPPGQAKKPVGDGESASAGGQGQGQAKQKG